MSLWNVLLTRNDTESWLSGSLKTRYKARCTSRPVNQQAPAGDTAFWKVGIYIVFVKTRSDLFRSLSVNIDGITAMLYVQARWRWFQIIPGDQELIDTWSIWFLFQVKLMDSIAWSFINLYHIEKRSTCLNLSGRLFSWSICCRSWYWIRPVKLCWWSEVWNTDWTLSLLVRYGKKNGINR